MIDNSVGSAASGRLATIDMEFRQPTPSDWTFRVLQAIFVGAAAVLLAIWLTGANTRSANDGGAQTTICKSFGKGGALCAPSSEAGAQVHAKPEPEPVCAFHYRAGVSCPPPIEK